MPELGRVHRVAVTGALPVGTLFDHNPGWTALGDAIRLRLRHGDYPRWRAAVDDLPLITADDVRFADTVQVAGALSGSDRERLIKSLETLRPWRKGPFDLCGVTIDTEWRSDWKWQRVRPHVDLAGHRVLDVGCGNGYYGWRMLEAGAASVTGIDPSLLYVMQHAAVNHIVQHPDHNVAPLSLEDLDALEPSQLVPFDTAFSMGVIYHRRDPVAHLQSLARVLRPGGRLVLETLTTGDEPSLVPGERYARMRNVWCVPGLDALTAWLTGSGFRRVAVVDLAPTSLKEQRSTHWMPFESLAQALDPNDPSRTVEGYPAPVRAVVTAYRQT